ncbi:MAG: M24 family metallopeptidase [Bacillota bacterium]
MHPWVRKRLLRLQERLGQGGIPLAIINNRENIIYFTGLTQVECLALLVPAEGEPCAVTIWLDADYVARETGLLTYGYRFPREHLAGKMVECIRQQRYPVDTIGFERYFVTFPVYQYLREALPHARMVDASGVIYQLRSIKEPEEVECIRQASHAVVAGMKAAVEAVKVGVTELEVLAEAEYAMLKAGSEGSPFRAQVTAGERVLLTHPCASNRRIQAGEVVVIHLGATYRGYCSKMCRTVGVGEIPRQVMETHRVLVEAQEAAIEALKPGQPVSEVDRAAREVVEACGYGEWFLDVTGYGVGIRQSEFYPIIGKGRTETIAAGMVVDLLLSTIYLPGVGGPRVTDVIYVGEEGNQLLTRWPKEMVLKE